MKDIKEKILKIKTWFLNKLLSPYMSFNVNEYLKPIKLEGKEQGMKELKMEVPEYLFGHQPKIERKNGGVHICPQCRGNAIQEEGIEGFKVCGVCKGERTVECYDESYHEDSYNYSFFSPTRRSWVDVIRIIAKDRPIDPVKEKSFGKIALYSNKKWLGYTLPMIHIVENDVNFGRD